MARVIHLTPDNWTQIVAPDNPDDVEILVGTGSFIMSLNTPHEKGAATMVQPPTPVNGPAWTKREVTPGIAAFAKAIDNRATAIVRPVTK